MKTSQEALLTKIDAFEQQIKNHAFYDKVIDTYLKDNSSYPFPDRGHDEFIPFDPSEAKYYPERAPVFEDEPYVTFMIDLLEESKNEFEQGNYSIAHHAFSRLYSIMDRYNWDTGHFIFDFDYLQNLLGIQKEGFPIISYYLVYFFRSEFLTVRNSGDYLTFLDTLLYYTLDPMMVIAEESPIPPYLLSESLRTIPELYDGSAESNDFIRFMATYDITHLAQELNEKENTTGRKINDLYTSYKNKHLLELWWECVWLYHEIDTIYTIAVKYSDPYPILILSYMIWFLQSDANTEDKVRRSMVWIENLPHRLEGKALLGEYLISQGMKQKNQHLIIVGKKTLAYNYPMKKNVLDWFYLCITTNRYEWVTEYIEFFKPIDDCYFPVDLLGWETTLSDTKYVPYHEIIEIMDILIYLLYKSFTKYADLINEYHYEIDPQELKKHPGFLLSILNLHISYVNSYRHLYFTKFGFKKDTVLSFNQISQFDQIQQALSHFTKLPLDSIALTHLLEYIVYYLYTEDDVDKLMDKEVLTYFIDKSKDYVQNHYNPQAKLDENLISQKTVFHINNLINILNTKSR